MQFAEMAVDETNYMSILKHESKVWWRKITEDYPQPPESLIPVMRHAVYTNDPPGNCEVYHCDRSSHSHHPKAASSSINCSP